MLNSRHHTRSRPSVSSGIRTPAGVTSTALDCEQAETVSAINRQHLAAISRLRSIIDLTRKAVAGADQRPRLRDTCKAKAEILLSPEEADALRSHLIASKSA